VIFIVNVIVIVNVVVIVNVANIRVSFTSIIISADLEK